MLALKRRIARVMVRLALPFSSTLWRSASTWLSCTDPGATYSGSTRFGRASISHRIAVLRDHRRMVGTWRAPPSATIVCILLLGQPGTAAHCRL